MKIRRILVSGVLAVSMLVAGATAATATETRQFEGEGYSDKGLALIYARFDAQRKANDAGFFDCTEIYTDASYYVAFVIWEGTR